MKFLVLTTAFAFSFTASAAITCKTEGHLVKISEVEKTLKLNEVVYPDCSFGTGELNNGGTHHFIQCGSYASEVEFTVNEVKGILVSPTIITFVNGDIINEVEGLKCTGSLQ